MLVKLMPTDNGTEKLENCTPVGNLPFGKWGERRRKGRACPNSGGWEVFNLFNQEEEVELKYGQMLCRKPY